MMVNLAGYHLKNAYAVAHWAEIQAGRAPRDPLLRDAEQRFFETLGLDPTEPSALNGLANIMFFQRRMWTPPSSSVLPQCHGPSQGIGLSRGRVGTSR